MEVQEIRTGDMGIDVFVKWIPGIERLPDARAV